ncbi:MAG TPA: hypothetical protein VHE35_22565 [Kofleriaceae bacterium]|nr:hypothetical protein [Kofleriaceae bacterium]
MPPTAPHRSLARVLALGLGLGLALAALPAAAVADPDGVSPAPGGAAPALTVGARVGGYGFRRPGDVDAHGHVAWDDCRMNGVGVFARRPLGRFFTEAAADLYFSESFPMATDEDDAGMDRMSGLFSAAIGADLVRTRHVTGYAQLGAGLELTRVSMAMPDGSVARDQRALPLGFVGVGGEVHLGARTSLGAMLRTDVMGHFDHDAETVERAAAMASGAGGELPVSPEIAAQGQFYVSYRL